MGLNKNLRIINVNNAGKVLTTDANGTVYASSKSVSDIASQTDLENLASRVDDLEDTTEEMQSRIEDINGEVVE